jgi:hypothetical protein
MDATYLRFVQAIPKLRICGCYRCRFWHIEEDACEQYRRVTSSNFSLIVSCMGNGCQVGLHGANRINKLVTNFAMTDVP